MAGKRKHLIIVTERKSLRPIITVHCGANVDVSDAGLKENMELPIDHLCKRCRAITMKYGVLDIRRSDEVRNAVAEINREYAADMTEAETEWESQHLAHAEREKARREAREAFDRANDAANVRFVEQMKLHPEYGEASLALSDRKVEIMVKTQEARSRVDALVVERFVESSDVMMKQVIETRRIEASIS